MQVHHTILHRTVRMPLRCGVRHCNMQARSQILNLQMRMPFGPACQYCEMRGYYQILNDTMRMPLTFGVQHCSMQCHHLILHHQCERCLGCQHVTMQGHDAILHQTMNALEFRLCTLQVARVSTIRTYAPTYGHSALRPAMAAPHAASNDAIAL
jgi:hypothetical protein